MEMDITMQESLPEIDILGSMMVLTTTVTGVPIFESWMEDLDLSVCSTKRATAAFYVHSTFRTGHRDTA